jgi:hypothetical protein
MEENLTWFLSLEPRFLEPLDQEMAITHAVMGRLMATAAADPVLGKNLGDRFELANSLYDQKRQEMLGAGKRMSRMRF